MIMLDASERIKHILFRSTYRYTNVFTHINNCKILSSLHVYPDSMDDGANSICRVLNIMITINTDYILLYAQNTLDQRNTKAKICCFGYPYFQ